MKSDTLKTSWNLNVIIKNEKDINKLRKTVEKESYKFINKWKGNNDYLKDPKILKEALDEYKNWLRNYGTHASENYYFGLKSQLNQNDSDIKAKKNKAVELAQKTLNDIQFFELNLSKVDEKTQRRLLNYKSLKPYKHFLERLFVSGKYTLSEREEKIMNLKSQVSHDNWIKMLSGFLTREEVETLDEDGKVKKKFFSDLFGLINSKKKKVRDSAAINLNMIFEKYLDVSENELNSVLQNKKINDELRGYERSDKARHVGDDIDSEIVDTLVKTVTDNFDIAKRYYQLKTKLMGVNKLKYHERNVEYGKIESKYSYSDGVNLINKVFSNLDSQFTEIFNNFVKNGLVDVYPASGKRGGAFCTYNLITNPVYILLNWTDKLDDVRTFAHEMGHAINDELIRSSQNAINFGTPTSTAEVASTFIEDFVIQELTKKVDDEQKLALMMNKLNQDISSIFRQVACYNFETELHRKFREIGYLSKEKIGEIFTKHMFSYMGNSVEKSKGSQNWWIYWSHIRMFFYVYSYASGLLISKSLQAEVKKDPKFINEVKLFLSAGLSKSPKDILLKLGIDISDSNFWEKGIKEINNLLIETEKLAKKLGKI